MSVADLGEHLLVSMRAVIAARRQPREESFWTKHFYSKKELPKLLGTSLTTLKMQGFLPQDFIEHQIAWKDFCAYSIDDAIEFGFTFEHMSRMGFQPQHFQQFEWRHYKQLRVNADTMIQTCMSIHDLNALKLTPQQLHQLKWSWSKMRSIGATQSNVTISSSDRQMYFKVPETGAASEPTKVGAFKF
jgi:hypothetical protein